jgi:hypothetical protein
MRFVPGLRLAALCLVAGFCCPAAAELIQTINFHLTAHVTTLVSTNGTTHVEKMKIVHLTTKEVLEMLGKATTNDFKGGTLVSVHRGQAYQVRRGTNVVADVSGFFADEGFSQDVIDQNFNSASGKDSYHGFWLRTLTFNDHHGNSFTLNGIIEEHYTAPVADSSGMQNVSDTVLLTGQGSGTLNGDFGGATADGDFALFSGTILFSGKGVVPLNTF